jgi:hypothetical protein
MGLGRFPLPQLRLGELEAKKPRDETEPAVDRHISVPPTMVRGVFAEMDSTCSGYRLMRQGPYPGPYRPA